MVGIGGNCVAQGALRFLSGPVDLCPERKNPAFAEKHKLWAIKRLDSGLGGLGALRAALTECLA